MKKRRYPGRISFKGDWLNMPLVSAVGFDSFRKPIPLSMHSHDGYELTYVTEGEVTWKIKDGPSLRLVGGDAAVTQPGSFHCGKWNIIQPCGLFWVVFTPFAPNASKLAPFSKRELASMDKVLHSAGNSVCSTSQRFRESFDSLLELMTRTEHDASNIFTAPRSRSLISEIFILATELFSRPSTEKKLPALLLEVDKFMRKHLSQNLKVEDIADAFGLSTTFFSEAFKKESGQTPADYFRRMKCEEACRVLRSRRCSVTETAFSLGFSSSQYFAGVFKKYTGMTPGCYKSFKKGN
ncbi:MAG: hypothetical protein A2020_03670 [Lentisphaerae bacterium GWF2_45_14]|nr:MAG: hypothetical protein A2020_03670 [Lentisphaerae bacterium GWF2_45_14]